ncbi:hypothetical protein ACVWZK_001947 [Bradyrhizobium sp. GM0.4]
MFYSTMTDRPATWRFPTMKQMQKLASSTGIDRKTQPARPLGPADDLPVEYWRALLDDPRAEANPAPPAGTLRLDQISQHL